MPVLPRKPNFRKRIIAFAVDAVIATPIWWGYWGDEPALPATGAVLGTAYWLLRDGLTLDFMDRRSIGKRFMKLRPIMLDGQPLNIVASIKRNWMFGINRNLPGIVAMVQSIPALRGNDDLVQIVIILIASVVIFSELALGLTNNNGRRIGDKLAGTQVIETED